MLRPALQEGYKQGTQLKPFLANRLCDLSSLGTLQLSKCKKKPYPICYTTPNINLIEVFFFSLRSLSFLSRLSIYISSL
jgi:hypothetical protein